RVEAGDYGQPVDHTSPDELGDLAQSFNHMTSAIERDLLEREKHEAALAEAKEAADVANRAKSDFLSNMSHELRTPLNGVLGYVQILQRDRTLGPSQKKSLDSISHCGEHLLSLINDVLDLSKIEAGRLEISEEATDLSQLLDGIRDIIQPKAASKGLQFLFKASPEVPRGIVTDPMKLSQVLINLLGNATKFTPDGTVSLRVSEAVKGELRFDVDDTGMGIGEEKLQEIFEPFKQAEGGETEGGTGLGLAISSRIAEALGGSLTATSELGDGSCFTLTIPLHETDDLKGEDFSVTVPGFDVHFRLPEGETRSVLIADDRETNREILDQILTDAGFETVLVDDGDVALERMRERDFDVFLCDVRMPRMNGIEVIKAIRADNELASAKVFAVTASVFPEFRDQALDAGFDEFLMKPLRVAELAQKLGKVLDLEFEGEPDPQPDQACAGAGGDPSELIAELPGDLLEELAEAAKGRNLTRLSAIVSSLLEDEQTSAAGQHLESMVMAFDFDALQQMVDGPEANGQNP
ncbi:MAG: ATP-binding protein, partial [Verrucomicrobiales bacterium]